MHIVGGWVVGVKGVGGVRSVVRGVWCGVWVCVGCAWAGPGLGVWCGLWVVDWKGVGGVEGRWEGVYGWGKGNKGIVVLGDKGIVRRGQCGCGG